MPRFESEPLRSSLQPLRGETADYDALLERIGDRNLVLIGEASHGTTEFYRIRAELTRRLIEEKNFDAVAAEADWPDAYRVNRFVRHTSDDPTAAQALEEFHRFPTWMWRNVEVLEFVRWLRERNADQSRPEARAGFYGLDLYSLHASVEAVLAYLDKVDASAAERARERYACLDHTEGRGPIGGYAAGLGIDPECEREVVAQLVELRRRAEEFARRDGRIAADEQFVAEQNARVVKNAEAYYRTLYFGRESSWNLRDEHMTDTLAALRREIPAQQKPPRIVVWEHNSHLGDARATEMGERGEWNVGQLCRERWGDEVFNIGFSTFEGSVTAASDWNQPAQRKLVRPGLEGSYERLFHEAEAGDFMLPCGDVPEALPGRRLERAIGVVYRPRTERASHYFFANLAQQFDAIFHIDETTALEPLERTAAWTREPETYPYGF